MPKRIMREYNMNDILSDSSKNATKKQAFGIKDIHIDDIVPSENNKYGIRDIEELAGNIESFGMYHNLVVEPINEGGKYKLISGERRYRACKLLLDGGNEGCTYLPCKIEHSNNPIITELQLIYANSTTRNLTDYEKTYQAGRLKELLTELKSSGYKLKGRMREFLADTLKVSPAQIGRMESINQNLSPQHKEEFKAGKIGISKAYKLSTAKTIPTNEQSQSKPNYADKLIRASDLLQQKANNPDSTAVHSSSPPPMIAIEQDQPMYTLRFSANARSDIGTRYSGLSKDKAFDTILTEYQKGSTLQSIQEG